ncbi:MAG: DNA-3-methyladenine glycosylase [Alicyclobacillus macrosporangiidus]|uniref:DNA-3-methyladenine glycosylase family protein n=1 Tax=Alicyclobacillus macrosporangiidus TaxID=392015 RepID=UPI0026F11CAD|nr:DNA-3-methyladenine glycosylase [Alicyclobacillus macrosporangiidus]MCL6600238.1 DNA-3-methyladenine glycosylase [Alicyclobacillus macrosporangiidus]
MTPKAPFDFAKMLQRPLSRPLKVNVIDPEALSYTTALRLPTRIIPVTIVSMGTVDHPTLRLTCPDGLSDEERTAVRETVCRMFSTEIDLTDFYARLSITEQGSALLKRHDGLRPIHDASLFESMVKVIIGQQLHVRFAAVLVDRLVELGGEAVEWNGMRLSVFPSSAQVACWSYEQLQALSFSRRKAEYVIDFARAVENGRVDLESLWRMPDDQIYEELLSLRGIGRWSVECFLLFGLGRPDVMPAADIGVQSAMQRLYGMAHRPGEAEVRRLAEAWAPWRSYATYYLWQSLIRAVSA